VRRLTSPRVAFGLGLLALLAVVGVGYLLGSRPFAVGSPPAPAASPLEPGSRSAFTYLAAQRSNYCSLQPATVMTYDDNRHLQGACCNAMDMTKYEWQVEGLRAYAAIPEVPKDPYDVPVALAKQLLGYDTSLALDAGQQAIYDSAMAMTEDEAPCCCQCWRWYMTAGLAKFLIQQQSMDAQQIASIVDLINGCGGPMDSSAGSHDLIASGST
jgi:hypothetical protein